jgi:hypothetical protein
MPNTAITPAALAGPTARARLNVIEFSATACGTSSCSTRAVISACWLGTAKALVTPRAPEQPITTHSLASPFHASAASSALIAVAQSWVASSSLLRSSRSAIEPAHGESTSTGTNWQKLRTPSRNAECVSRKTTIDAARFWNHVPLADDALPTKYGPKLRERITRHAAAGPTAAVALMGQPSAGL